MQNNGNKIELKDIGYYGNPIDTLTKEELQKAFLEVVQLLNHYGSANEDSNDLNIAKHEEHAEVKMIEKRSGKDRRITGDRRLGTNPKGYNGPEKRSIFDRRSYDERRQPNIESE